MNYVPFTSKWCGQTQPHPQHTWVDADSLYKTCAGHS